MPRRRQKKEGSPASPPRGRSQARTPDSSPRRRGAAPSPKTRALAFLATPPPVSMPPRPALALAYEDAAARELALDVAYESDETSEDPRLLPAIATEIEAYDDPKQISPGYSTSEGEDEAGRLGCDLSPYSTSEDEDHAAPLRGRGPLPSYRPSKLTRRSKALGARRRGKTVAFASEPLSVAILTPVTPASAVKPQRVFSPVAPVEVLELSRAEVLPPRRWRRGPLFVLAVVLGALFASGLKTTPASVSSTPVRMQATHIGLSLTTPLRPSTARLARVPVATPFPESTADAVPLVVLAAATGAVTDVVRCERRLTAAGTSSEFFTGAARLTGAAERSLGEWPPTRPVEAFVGVCLTGAAESADAALVSAYAAAMALMGPPRRPLPLRPSLLFLARTA